MTIQFLTGTDSQTFVQMLFLLQSFDAMGARSALAVCDFGMTDEQRRFLDERGQLLPALDLPQDRRHPWYQKTALARFAPAEAEALVWLDADMIVTRDLRPLVARLVGAMKRDGQAVAACQDDCGFDIATFATAAAKAGRNVALFLRLLIGERTDLSRPYLNTGFFVTTSRPLLEDWRALTFAIEQHFLFDQSTFNTVAWRSPAQVRVLDWRQWNVHGHALGRVAAGPVAGQFRCDERTSYVLHATSPAETHHAYKAYQWQVAGRVQRADVKLFRNPVLRQLQLQTLQRFMAENQGNAALGL